MSINVMSPENPMKKSVISMISPGIRLKKTSTKNLSYLDDGMRSPGLR